MAESLVKDLMKKVYRKLHNRLLQRIKGDGYSISLTDEEAKAYYIYFLNRSLGPQWQYETIMINAHINQINQLYA
jgi:hypothetical protein